MSRRDETPAGPQMRLAGPALYWDAPVVEALDVVEVLSRFSARHIEWDNFRFWSSGGGTPMRGAFIYAYPLSTPDTVLRFGVDDGRFTVSTRLHGRVRGLSVSETARLLDVPVDSATRASAVLRDALAQSVARYNVAHGLVSASTPASTARPAPAPYVSLTDRPIADPAPHRSEGIDL